VLPDGDAPPVAYGRDMSALTTHTDSLLAHRTVDQAMHRGVITCAGESSVAHVAATMAAHAIHAAAILSPEGDRALALSDLDVIRAALDGARRSASEIAREPMMTVSPRAPLATAVALMATQDVSHLLVAAEADADWPAGVISSFDVVSVLAGRDPALTRMIRPGAARPLVSATALADTTVEAVMHPGVVHCPPETRLTELAATMADLRLHCVAVSGVGRRDGGDEHFVWGLVSDMDVVHAAYRGELGVPAGEVAATAPLALAESGTLHRAATLMVEHEAAHVIAIGRTGLPSGVVSTLDVLRIVAAG
jgi:CBS domain-containing protein